jgi:hypothetical protein
MASKEEKDGKVMGSPDPKRLHVNLIKDKGSSSHAQETVKDRCTVIANSGMHELIRHPLSKASNLRGRVLGEFEINVHVLYQHYEFHED